MSDDSLPAVTRAIRAFANEDISTDALLRALIGHRTWLVPVTWKVAAGDASAARNVVVFGQETRLPAGQIWMFTDLAAGTLAAERGDRLGVYCEATGIEAFWHYLGRTGGTVVVNAASGAEDSMVLAGNGVAQAVAWARSIRVEELLGDPGVNIVSVLDEVLGHPSYLVAHDGKGEPIVSRGSHYRKGLHAFTTPDCLQRWSEAIGVADVKGQVMAGNAVFRLGYERDCDMLCFNSVGPGKGRDVPLETKKTAPGISVVGRGRSPRRR